MPPKKKKPVKARPERKAVRKAAPKGKKPVARKAAAKTFPQALAALLRTRGIPVPSGLKDAPREAYAGQPASVVEILSKLSDAEIASHAEKVAGYTKRQAERAKAMWDQSPLISELRTRRLKEPVRPDRVVGAAFSFKKPLRDWTDAELLEAAKEWSRRAREK